jgi:hypothetical protein
MNQPTDDPLDRCRSERSLARAHILSGGCDFGALMGYGDWWIEECLILHERSAERVGMRGVAEAHWAAVEKAMEEEA